jgi:hypothetical protein
MLYAYTIQLYAYAIQKNGKKFGAGAIIILPLDTFSSFRQRPESFHCRPTLPRTTPAKPECRNKKPLLYVRKGLPGITIIQTVSPRRPYLSGAVAFSFYTGISMAE